MTVIIMSFVALGQLLLSVFRCPHSAKWHATVLILFLGLVSGLFSFIVEYYLKSTL